MTKSLSLSVYSGDELYSRTYLVCHNGPKWTLEASGNVKLHWSIHGPFISRPPFQTFPTLPNLKHFLCLQFLLQILLPIKARKWKVLEEDRCKLPKPPPAHLSASMLTHCICSHHRQHPCLFTWWHPCTCIQFQVIILVMQNQVGWLFLHGKKTKPSWPPPHFLLLNKVSSWKCHVPSLSPFLFQLSKLLPPDFYFTSSNYWS